MARIGEINYNPAQMLKTWWLSARKYFLLALVIGGVLSGVSLWTTSQMQDMQTELREDEIAPVDGSQTRPERETVAYYWDAEDLVAQQIFRALQIKRDENTQMILNNVEQNLQFNRNKAAVHFYLAAAYEALGKPERASGFYIALMENFNNRNIALDVFDDGVLRADGSVRYSVSIQEEAALRLCRLYASPDFLGTVPPTELFLFLQDSKNTFGPEGKPGFLYSDLVALAQSEPSALLSVEEFCSQRLDPAAAFMRKFIRAVQSDDPEINSQAAAMIADSASRTMANEADRVYSLGASSALSLELAIRLDAIRKDREAYLYEFTYIPAELKFTLRDDLRGTRIIEKVQK